MKPLRLPQRNPDEQRRARLLNTLLIGTIVLGFLMAIVFATSLTLSAEERILATTGMTVYAVGILIILAINRYWSNRIAAWLFLGLLIVVLAISDTPFEVVRGRTLFLFTIPIFASAVLLPAYSTFIVAGLVSLAISYVSFNAQLGFLWIQMTGFLMISLVVWLAARSLEQALTQVRQSNRQLEEAQAALTQTNETLSASEAEVRAIFEAITDAIFVIDADGRYVRIAPTSNPNVLIAFADMLGKTLYDVLPDKQAREFHNNIQQVLTSRKTMQVEYSLQIEADNWWEATISPLGSNETVWVARNITERKHIEEALRQSEFNLREAQAIAKLGNFEFHLHTQQVRWSDETYRIFGVPIREEIALERYQSLLAPEDFERVMTAVGEAIASQEPYTIEHDIILSNRQRKHLYAIGRPLVDEMGEVNRIFGTIQDVTESKKAGQALRENAARYRALFDHAFDAVWVYSADGKVVTANPRACELSGYTLEEMIGQTPEFFTVPEEQDEANKRHRQAVMQGANPSFYERTIVRKNGEHRLCEIRGTRVEDEAGKVLFVQGTVRDITDRKQAETKILASLREKEVLLKEIHHRVKNNLQVISSLLDLQSGYLEDEHIQEMFQESRSRVRSMALVHEQLYQSADLARIDFADYVQSLMGYLMRVYGHMARRVVLDIDVAHASLSVETAVPLGLIINELVSNAYKHAFVDGRSGQIVVQLNTENEPEMVLTIKDSGVGLPANFDWQQANSLGLSIVHTLVQQLQGEVMFENRTGTAVTITFTQEKHI
ncbi:PAS domain S-box protein [Candidatus Leptofilum sp.]|uniref:PAS domain S-box protein n=1 Tax=Candidatus Leptofilum sp. TaxID=3241576 RepID=UPI003B5B6387